MGFPCLPELTDNSAVLSRICDLFPPKFESHHTHTHTDLEVYSMSTGSAAGNTTERSQFGSGDAQLQPHVTRPLTLGIAPVALSSGIIKIGRLDPLKSPSIDELRRKHGATHAFRFDARDRQIACIGIGVDTAPLGAVAEVPGHEHLLLLAEAIEHQLRAWLARGRKILRRFHPLICLGGRDCLLAKALREAGVQSPDKRLDVVAKWSFEVRMLTPSDPDAKLSIGLIIDVGTSNVIDIPVSELAKRGFDSTGCYVGMLGEVDDLIASSQLKTVGRAKALDNGVLSLEDVRRDFQGSRIDAATVFVEPRNETLERVTRALYQRDGEQALAKLRRIRAPYLSGDGKLRKIEGMIADLNASIDKGSLSLAFSGGLHVRFGKLLDEESPHFPPVIETSRPNMLFGASGHNQEKQPDVGIQKYGPFQYAQNPTNEPTVVVLSDRGARGRMDEFAKALRDGLKNDIGGFSGGLIGKFRLTNLKFHFAEISSDTAAGYSEAAAKALNELPQLPALALVQVRESHKQRVARENPYFAAKAHFMRSGVPVQAVRLETIEQTRGRAYTLNNLALAAYAKIGGVPWVIATRGVATHELIIGIGSTEIAESRLGERKRYVGITTLFQGDGRYVVWETTREATFENYPQALLESLRSSIRFVQLQNRWEAGDNVRLVFHAYKPLKRVEIETAKALVREMLHEYPVEFAFLDISHHHAYQIFDPAQEGSKYWSQELKQRMSKGVYAPQRGTAILLGSRTALLQLVGTKDVKTWEQGMPRPLLLELHRDSDFCDLTYLVRQAYHFSFMSWRSFFPSHEPVTILYSRWIANLLGNLRAVPGWDGSVLSIMRDRKAMWFL